MPEEPAKLDETLDAKPYEPPKHTRSLTGFYVAMGVLAALILLAAVLIKPLATRYRERRDEIGNRAVFRCRWYVEAQAIYRAKDWDKNGKLGYAHPFGLLFSTEGEDGVPIQLIDGSFAQADGSGYGYCATGYYFQDCQTIGGVVIDWERDFALSAYPMVYGRTGYRVFIVKTDGVIWAKDLGRAEPVADFPADPAREGWRVVR
jgi:hypothetical protein